MLFSPNFSSEENPPTSLEKVDILDRRGFARLRGHGVHVGANVVVCVIFEPVIITEEILREQVAALPSSMSVPPAGPPPPAAPPPRWRWWRYCGLGTEVDSTHHGRIHRRLDAHPVPADETRASVVPVH